ncbi:MAG: glycosyl hydrolase 115 family protein [Janthinobacterium lividum]
MSALFCRPQRRVAARTAAILLGLASLHGRASNAQKSGEPFLLQGQVTILSAADAPLPIQKACEDLASDLTRVLGTAPRIVHDAANLRGPVLLIGGSAGYSGSSSNEAESFSLRVRSSDAATPRRVLQLAGADTRGTMYAIYQFSQEFLGVDPMYYWTDNEPKHRDLIRIPGSLDEQVASPVFKHRGFFINDEDLLTGWAPGEKSDHTGISLEVWNKIFETVLRLKGDMVGAGTWPFSDDAQNKLLLERGLLLSQHHAEPLGANFSRWPQNVPYNYTTHPEIIRNAWANSVAGYSRQQDILWSVGLRGLSDQPYADLDPAVKDDPAAQGRIISKAIADQMSLVRKTHPDAQFVTDLWMEGAKLMKSGDLTVPPEVTTVWADSGYGDMQDAGQVKAGQGAYIHTAMMNFAANQLSEMVPTERLFSELGRYQAAGATSFLLVNTSDIRPVTMNARATMDFGWSGTKLGSASDFQNGWGKLEFGPAVAPEIASLYKEYFAAPAHNRVPERTDGDMYYQVQARQMLLGTMLKWAVYMIPDQKPMWMEPHAISGTATSAAAFASATLEIPRLSEAQKRWDAVWQHASLLRSRVAPDRTPFYDAGILTMISINREGNRMLLELSRAVVALQQGQRDLAEVHVKDALAALDEIKHNEKQAEYGKWKNWYRGDWLTGVDSTRSMLASFQAWLQTPDDVMLPPVTWDFWKAYFFIQHYQGDRQLDVQAHP